MRPNLRPSGWIAFALDQIQVIAHIDGFRKGGKFSSIFRIEEIGWFIFDHCCSTVERTWTAWARLSITNSQLWTWFWIFNYRRCKIPQPNSAITFRLGRWTKPSTCLKKRNARTGTLELKWKYQTQSKSNSNIGVSTRWVSSIGFTWHGQADYVVTKRDRNYCLR